MRKHRYTSFLLAALLLTAMSACAQEPQDSDSSDTVTTALPDDADTEELSEMEKRALITDDLPEKDYDGMQFRISTKKGTLYEIDTEETDGDILNDALFERNQRIEERFNIEIVPVITDSTDGYEHVNSVRQSIMAADDSFDLAATYVFTTGPLVTEGCFLNWLNMPHTDLSKPWWINGINEKFQVGDAIYTAVGDTCLSTLKLTYGVFFNRTIGEDYGYTETIYDTIRCGEWTIDKFIEMTRDVYSDVNGDTVRDSGDFYGFTAEKYTNLDVYPFAFDISIISNDKNGVPQLSLNTPKTIEAIEKINTLYWGAEGSYIPEDSFEPITMFKNGNALFTTTYLENAFSTFRDMNDDYSILPYPKWDESQEKYMTGAMDNYSVLGIPVTVSDPEMVSIITEALNIESYKTLYPTYYKQALQDKFSRDEESIEMIDLLISGRNFDFCTLFSSNIPGMPWMFRTLVAANSNDFASAYAASEAAAQIELDRILEAYEKNADN